MTTLDERPAPARLELNDIGRITLRTSAPVLADRYADNRITGAFILIDEHTNDTVGAGMIEATRERHPVAAGRRDVTWHHSELDREQRWDVARHPRRDGLAHRAPRVGQVDDRRRARAQARRVGPGRLPARRRQRPPRALRRPRLRARRPQRAHPPRRPRRPPAGRRRHRRRGVARLADGGRPRASRASSTRRRASTSSRSTSPPRWRSASAATPRVSTRAPAPASSRASPASTRPTRRPSGRTSSSTPRAMTVRTRSRACSTHSLQADLHGPGGSARRCRRRARPRARRRSRRATSRGRTPRARRRPRCRRPTLRGGGRSVGEPRSRVERRHDAADDGDAERAAELARRVVDGRADVRRARAGASP